MLTNRGWGCVVLIFGFLMAGCATVLPRHPHSEDRDGEVVMVRFLDSDAMKPYADAWCEAFHRDEMIEEKVALLPEEKGIGARAVPAIVGTVLGLGVDHLVEMLREEAARYEAQFEGQCSVDDFWTWKDEKKAWVQHYLGVEIIRSTSAHPYPDPADPKAGDLKDGEAFHLVLGIASTKDKSGFLVAPLRLHVGAAKAKVLAIRWWSYIPVFAYQFLSSEPGFHVKTEVALESRVAWVEDGVYRTRFLGHGIDLRRTA